ncbi:Acidic mammalian chitinase [Dissostichus eleginoides]|uniref:Acidic mammalian chitinase n=1 Tax=Dissostichus eleginoides TaxID=100907 RepID=A0AAD9B291_DISEL|nr:Acidic mammalian chitinase [Dissostichus eleginoides]
MGDVGMFSREWTKGDSVWSVGGVHSTGVGILFCFKEIRVEDVFVIDQGRAIGADITWGTRKLRVIVVYGPQSPAERTNLFTSVEPFLVTNRQVFKPEHGSVRAKKARQVVTGIRDSQGILVTEDGQMVRVATDHFRDSFKEKEVGRGDDFLELLERKVPGDIDSVTACNSPVLQLQTAVTNTVHIMSDYPPNFHTCSSDVSGSISTTIATQPRSRAGPGLTGVEEEGEPRSLKRCASLLTPEVAQQQLHYTDDSRIFPDETLWISTPRAIVIQPPGSAQPVDLKPTNSILPVNTLCDGPAGGKGVAWDVEDPSQGHREGLDWDNYVGVCSRGRPPQLLWFLFKAYKSFAFY